MTPPIDLRASFGSKISEMKDLCKDNHLTIVDTNKDGIFDKNDKVQYGVQAGDYLGKIARKFKDCSLSQLKEVNKDNCPNPDKIKEGDKITIPLVEKKAETSAKPKKRKEEYKFETRDFGNIKTRHVIDKNIQSLLKGEKVETLKNGKFYVDDKNGNGIFDEGEGLYKQVSVMLDAGHDSRLRGNQKINIPNKGVYTTKENDTYESIAQAFGVSAEDIKTANSSARAKDPGALGGDGKLNEADITGIARDELADKLRADGFDVIMAKRTDRAHLKERQEEKLDKQPDMYVSLHCNSAAGDAKGEEVCYREDEDKAFATTIKDALAKDDTFATRKNPLLSGKFMVLGGDKDNRTAECLVEMGFMSGDYAKLTDATTRGQQLDAIADGIKNHYNANKAK